MEERAGRGSIKPYLDKLTLGVTRILGKPQEAGAQVQRPWVAMGTSGRCIGINAGPLQPWVAAAACEL